MTPKEVIRDLISIGSLPKIAIVIFIIGIRIFGELSDNEVSTFLTQLGYTYTNLDGLDTVIVSNDTNTYTLVQLITKYHDELFSTSILMPNAVIATIIKAFDNGYLNQTEETALEGLYTNG